MASASPKNCYETRDQTVIPAVLIYALHEGSVLLMHRNRKPSDAHRGKWNGLGGKMERGESPRQAAAREWFEESGVRFEESLFRAAGVIHFPNFRPDLRQDWTVFLFVVEAPTRKMIADSPEGDLEWVSRDKILNLNLWAGDRLFVPAVLDGKAVFGTLWYEGENVTQSWIQISPEDSFQSPNAGPNRS